jgi:hypothetical protein
MRKSHIGITTDYDSSFLEIGFDECSEGQKPGGDITYYMLAFAGQRLGLRKTRLGRERRREG